MKLLARHLIIREFVTDREVEFITQPGGSPALADEIVECPPPRFASGHKQRIRLTAAPHDFREFFLGSRRRLLCLFVNSILDQSPVA